MGMATISFERNRMIDLALELVERKLRTTPAHVLTGLPEPELRHLYRMVHGRSPSSGSIPSTGHLLSSRRRQAKISAYASIYIGMAKDPKRWTLEGRGLIRSYDLFIALIGTDAVDEIDLTACWSVLRELLAGISRRPLCGQCGAYYIITANADVPPTCPFCALRRKKSGTVPLP
jgi:hypothetical protein